MFLLPKSDLILFINYKLNYVAIGRLPAEIGNKATLLLPFATPVHWIFAGSSSNALNGFRLTGGVFTRQSDSTFFNEQDDQIETLYISQNHFWTMIRNGFYLKTI